jgi:hypothetical protein
MAVKSLQQHTKYDLTDEEWLALTAPDKKIQGITDR